MAAQPPLRQHVRLRRMSAPALPDEAETTEARHLIRLRGLLAPAAPDDDATTEARLLRRAPDFPQTSPRKKRRAWLSKGPLLPGLRDARARSGLHKCHGLVAALAFQHRCLGKLQHPG